MTPAGVFEGWTWNDSVAVAPVETLKLFARQYAADRCSLQDVERPVAIARRRYRHQLAGLEHVSALQTQTDEDCHRTCLGLGLGWKQRVVAPF